MEKLVYVMTPSLLVFITFFIGVNGNMSDILQNFVTPIIIATIGTGLGATVAFQWQKHNENKKKKKNDEANSYHLFEQVSYQYNVMNGIWSSSYAPLSNNSIESRSLRLRGAIIDRDVYDHELPRTRDILFLSHMDEDKELVKKIIQNNRKYEECFRITNKRASLYNECFYSNIPDVNSRFVKEVTRSLMFAEFGEHNAIRLMDLTNKSFTAIGDFLLFNGELQKILSEKFQEYFNSADGFLVSEEIKTYGHSKKYNIEPLEILDEVAVPLINKLTEIGHPIPDFLKRSSS